MLMAFESFLGVLFGSVTGAIIFAKIARNGNVAHVRFSYPLCIKYGSGVVTNSQRDIDDDDDCSSIDDEECNTKIPCPVLEFRIINEMCNEGGGEIVNATVHVVASTEAVTDEDVVSQRRGNKRLGSSVNTAKKVADARNLLANVTTKAATRTGVAITGAVKAAATTGNKCRLSTYGTIVQKLHGTKSDVSMQEESAADVTSDDVSSHTDAVSRVTFEDEAEPLLNHLQGERRNKEKNVFLMSSITLDEGDTNLAPPRLYHKLDVSNSACCYLQK